MGGSERFARTVLFASALAFAGPGAAFLLTPERSAALVGIALLTSTAANDVRAVFGGLELAIAALLAAAALGGRSLEGALALQRCALAGLLVGRVLSLARDGAPSAFAWLLFAIEAVLLAAGLAARSPVSGLRPR